MHFVLSSIVKSLPGSLKTPLCLALLALLLVPVLSAASDRQPLTHDVYSIWNRIHDPAISADGRWVAWEQAPERADGELVVQAPGEGLEYRVERGNGPEFSRDSRFLVFRIKPAVEDVRQARLDDLPEDQHPQPALGLIDLSDGSQASIERVVSFALSAESGRWLAWLVGSVPEDEETEEGSTEDQGPAESESDEGSSNGRDDDQEAGETLIIQSLADNRRWTIEHVNHYAWAEDGRRLALTRVSPDGSEDGVFLIDPEDGSEFALVEGKGRYLAPVFSENGERLAVLGRHHDEDRASHLFDLFVWHQDDDQARSLLEQHPDFLAEGWHVSRHRQPMFSDSGQRLFFGIAPPPVEMPDADDVLSDEVVKVDIWHWQDPELQSMQLVRLEEQQRRTYLSVARFDNGRTDLIQLGQPEIPEISLPDGADSRFALGYSNLPYRKKISWDFPRYFDAWRVDVDSGQAELIVEGIQDLPQISPSGHYAFWWDREAATWFAVRLADGAAVDLGVGIAQDLADHRNDRPFGDPPYGAAGWLKDDLAFLVHDRHDLWRVDPDRPEVAVNLSQGMGRERAWNIRLLDLDPDQAGFDPDQPLLASAFDETSKAHGFVELQADGSAVEELKISDHRYGPPRRAQDNDRLLFTRENFDEFPNLWVSDGRLADPSQVSDANPQQADYRWGSVDLVEWRARDGRDHQGLLFKPDDFDPERTYPMIVYFYERDSDGLHRHRPPQAHRSVIIPTFYTSNDYVVFVPDVWYREGYPGDSAMASIMPKVHRLADEPWIDAERIGIQGHSWAGYQIAYMLTQTNRFRAAAGGAPVANMTSAYGGIRWRTGMSRMFQYERTQSRLGRTLWEAPELYIRNSPLFKADRIETPLLMMHNDGDGAVPWEQGIELFTALRRLGRPAWLVNYNDEPHWPTSFANRRDWQIRLQQFFDHYLKDAPAPRWLSEGIPALEKGATLGLETD